ncbi:unnamed protein product [Acanthoscelides obtectus]|uniref:Uncharacterized protein n=1 Tax=Acanthoscelides obtectus TaxID=200917 RepID=A0A9P0L246_ACAOB|nr:unnamed protein product [Acanthoscelides obtectus]CAK1638368.1 hypothetical protein AOBTE_LOCUS10568 [Acanthoscelides obtectus]
MSSMQSSLVIFAIDIVIFCYKYVDQWKGHKHFLLEEFQYSSDQNGIQSGLPPFKYREKKRNRNLWEL